MVVYLKGWLINIYWYNNYKKHYFNYDEEEKHYENFKNLLEGYNIEIALLTGSTKKSEKN